jgi:hypothetical protein
LLLPVRTRIWKPLLVVLLFLLISYIPNFHVLMSRLGSFSAGTWVHKPHITELYGNINRFLNSRFVTLVLMLIAITGMVIIFARNKTGEIAEKLRNDHALWMLLLWFLLPYLGMFVISIAFPVFLDRYILFTAPFLYLLIAIFFTYIPVKRWLQYLLAGVMFVSMLMFFNLNPDNHRRVAELASKVKTIKEQGGIVLISPEYASLEFVYYYDRNAYRSYNTTAEKLRSDHIYPVRSLKQLQEGVLDSAKRVIYVDCGTAFAFGEDVLGRELKQNFTIKGSMNVYEIYWIKEFIRK